MSLPKPPQLRAVLFDAGNTLCFLDHDVLAALAHKRGTPGIDARSLNAAEAAAKRAYEALLGQGATHEEGWRLFMEQLFLHGGAGPRAAEQLADDAWAEHTRFNLWRRVPTDLVPALERLREAGLRLGVVSNAEGTVEDLLTQVGLRDHLELVVDSHHEGVRKPDPEIFRRAVGRLGLSPEQCLYVGDIPEVDVEGARGAGLEAVLVDTRNHYPDYVGATRVASVSELVDLLL